MKWQHTYLCEIQFLGFRLHGWAKQPGIKTVHLMLDRTIKFVLCHDKFKSLAASRTDARVSAEEFPVQLFTMEPISDKEAFIAEMNINLPADMKMLSCREVSESFNIIQSPKSKEYHYYFYFGHDKFPLAAAHMSYFPQALDIPLMQQAAALFQGEHDFRKYVTQPAKGTQTVRTIEISELSRNERLQGSMFPPESYVFRVSSQGFMRHQIRLMVGQLVQLGSGNCSMEEFTQSLTNPDDSRFDYIAPGSGLVLHRTIYSD